MRISLPIVAISSPNDDFLTKCNFSKFSQITDHFLFKVPHYMICPFPRNEDIWISGNIHNGIPWEGDVTHLLVKMLSCLHSRTNKVVFLDVGANIGSHTIPIAALGYHVWAVEPMQETFMKVTQKAIICHDGQC